MYCTTHHSQLNQALLTRATCSSIGGGSTGANGQKNSFTFHLKVSQSNFSKGFTRKDQLHAAVDILISTVQAAGKREDLSIRKASEGDGRYHPRGLWHEPQSFAWLTPLSVSSSGFVCISVTHVALQPKTPRFFQQLFLNVLRYHKWIIFSLWKTIKDITEGNGHTDVSYKMRTELEGRKANWELYMQ